MQNYPPPGGYNQGQGGYNQGYDQNQGQGGYNQGHNSSGSGYGHQPQGGGQGYDQWNPNSGGQQNFGGGSSGYGAPNAYPQQGGGFNSNSQAPPGYPQQQGSFGQGGPGQYDAQSVPLEHLPPGYNPATRAPYQAHELPPGAQLAGPGEEGEFSSSISITSMQDSLCHASGSSYALDLAELQTDAIHSDGVNTKLPSIPRVVSMMTEQHIVALLCTFDIFFCSIWLATCQLSVSLSCLCNGFGEP